MLFDQSRGLIFQLYVVLLLELFKLFGHYVLKFSENTRKFCITLAIEAQGYVALLTFIVLLLEKHRLEAFVDLRLSDNL